MQKRKWQKFVKNRQVFQADFSLTNLTRILQNHQFRQADFALTNWTKIRQTL